MTSRFTRLSKNNPIELNLIPKKDIIFIISRQLFLVQRPAAGSIFRNLSSAIFRPSFFSSQIVNAGAIL